jgi:bifunctional DNase/RNase
MAAVLSGAKPFAISLVVETDGYQQQVIFLHEAGAQRLVPILTGAVEAAAIVQKLTSVPGLWPSMHDAMAAVIRACGADVRDAIVHDLEQHTYYAKLRIERGADSEEIKMRPTDAFLLALAFDRPIFVSDAVLGKLE